MCGLCGFVHAHRDSPIDAGALAWMRDALEHRGPDDAGLYAGPGVGLGSRRLAIIDLSDRGRMPMSTPDGRYHIVYNGEVYNYRDLRAPLETKGYPFHSNTDTEVLLALYREEGPAMLHRLNGMFAFAVWDEHQRELFLARDRLGIKPLYYAQRGDCLAFASEEKALFRAGVEPAFDPAAWTELLCFRYVAGERTPFAGVRRLLPGHYLRWRDGRFSCHRWWSLADRARARRAEAPADPAAWFARTFDSAIDLRRISDVPLGVLLSGGLDSSTVAASLALQQGDGVASFTVRFREADYDEGPLAQELAAQYRLERHELFVPPGDLPERLARAAWFLDEPLAHGNDLYIHEISRYAKPRVTVLLSGEGSDEVLGGYVRYRPLYFPGALAAGRRVFPRLASWLRLGGRAGKLARFLSLGPTRQFVRFNSCNVLPDDLAGLGMVPDQEFPYRDQMLAEAEGLYPGEAVRQAMYLDQHTFLCSLLDRNDRMTMGASVECRVPFLDYRLVEGLAALPTSAFLRWRPGKYLLRRALGARLPASVLRHRKWGFGVPWNSYLRGTPSLREQVAQLPDAAPVADGPFEKARVRGLVDGYLAGDDAGSPLLLQLLMVALWHRVCVRGNAGAAGPAPAPRPAEALMSPPPPADGIRPW